MPDEHPAATRDDAQGRRERWKFIGFLAGMAVIWGYPWVFLAVTHGL